MVFEALPNPGTNLAGTAEKNKAMNAVVYWETIANTTTVLLNGLNLSICIVYLAISRVFPSDYGDFPKGCGYLHQLI